MLPSLARGQVCTCTVVVCTRERPAELRRCLESLSRLRYSSFEVLVVDNASSDSQAIDLARLYGAQYVFDPIPGLSHARNVGARASTTDIIAYLDDDAVAEPDWLDELVAEFNDSEVAAVVGRCVPLKVETEAERLWVKMYGTAWGRENRFVLDRDTPDWLVYAAFGGVGTGGSMAFRRAAFDVWPGFDERLGRGMPIDGNEEHYAFLSLVRLGYKIVAAPGAIVRHPPPSTTDALRTRRLKDRASLSGFFCLLLVEEKGLRLETLRYIFRRMRKGGGEGMRSRMPEEILSLGSSLLARLQGPWLYLLSNWRARRNRRMPAPNGTASGAAHKQIPGDQAI